MCPSVFHKLERWKPHFQDFPAAGVLVISSVVWMRWVWADHHQEARARGKPSEYCFAVASGKRSPKEPGVQPWQSWALSLLSGSCSPQSYSAATAKSPCSPGAQWCFLMPSRSWLWLCHVLGFTLNLEPMSLAFPTIWREPSFFLLKSFLFTTVRVVHFPQLSTEFYWCPLSDGRWEPSVHKGVFYHWHY